MWLCQLYTCFLSAKPLATARSIREAQTSIVCSKPFCTDKLMTIFIVLLLTVSTRFTYHIQHPELLPCHVCCNFGNRPLSLSLFFYNRISPFEYFPWEISVAFPGENKPRQSRAIQPRVHTGSFGVSIIHRTVTWTTESLTCAQMLMRGIAHGEVRIP